MNRYIRFMEQIISSVGGGRQAVLLYLATLPIVAILRGRPIAFVERYVAVRSLVGLPGTVRYVGADGALGVHLDHDPLEVVTEYPRDMVRVTWGGITLRAIEAHLATKPEPSCNLDAAAPL